MSGGGFGSGDENVLDLLGESKDKGSHKGSQSSAMKPQRGANLMGSIE